MADPRQPDDSSPLDFDLDLDEIIVGGPDAAQESPAGAEQPERGSELDELGELDGLDEAEKVADLEELEEIEDDAAGESEVMPETEAEPAIESVADEAEDETGDDAVALPDAELAEEPEADVVPEVTAGLEEIVEVVFDDDEEEGYLEAAPEAEEVLGADEEITAEDAESVVDVEELPELDDLDDLEPLPDVSAAQETTEQSEDSARESVEVVSAEIEHGSEVVTPAETDSPPIAEAAEAPVELEDLDDLDALEDLEPADSTPAPPETGMGQGSAAEDLPDLDDLEDLDEPSPPESRTTPLPPARSPELAAASEPAPKPAAPTLPKEPAPPAAAPPDDDDLVGLDDLDGLDYATEADEESPAPALAPADEGVPDEITGAVLEKENALAEGQRRKAAPIELAAIGMVALLILAGVFLFLRSVLSGTSDEGAKGPVPVPSQIEGSLFKLGKVKAYWRSRRDSDRAQEDSRILPEIVVELTSGSSGYLQALFRDENGVLRGDSVTARISGGKFEGGGTTWKILGTEGFPNESFFAAYRAVGDDLAWSVSLRESKDNAQWSEISSFGIPPVREVP